MYMVTVNCDADGFHNAVDQGICTQLPWHIFRQQGKDGRGGEGKLPNIRTFLVSPSPNSPSSPLGDILPNAPNN